MLGTAALVPCVDISRYGIFVPPSLVGPAPSKIVTVPEIIVVLGVRCVVLVDFVIIGSIKNTHDSTSILPKIETQK